MKKQIQISVTKPCHENWDMMSKTEQGKFCGSCQKQVVDFSSMNDRQLAEFFKRPSTGSMCGRFMADQLERPIDIARKRIPWLKYFFQMLLPAFFLSKASAQTKIMGKIARPVRDTTKICISDERRTMGIVSPNIEPFEKDTTKITIPKADEVYKVIITDEQGEPVPFATIDKGEGKALFADKNGELQIRQSELAKNNTLVVSSRGYESRKMVVLTVYNNTITITLRKNSEITDISSPRAMILGEIMIVDPKQTNKPDSAYATDQIIQRDVVVPDERNKFYVFPNPVKSGGFIGLGVQLLEAGSYDCQFLDLSGKLVMQKEISIDPESRLMNIDAPSVPSGSYLFVLVNKKSGKKYSEKIIIQ